MHEKFQQAAKIIKNADALLITAGAGMGVDSGLPDFRGNKGFWKAYPVVAKMKRSFIEMANPEWFEVEPDLAWAFYGHRLNLYRETNPHQGFYQLLEMGETMPGGYFVFTSNVDGQFQKAGCKENKIEECHGSIQHFQCSKPCHKKIWDAPPQNIAINEATFRALPPLPQCPECKAVARPNVLMFGDWTWIGSRSNQQSSLREKWIDTLTAKKQKLVIIEMGAGKAVPTVRMFSQRVARYLNATLIRINPRDFDTPKGHIPINTGAAEGVEKIYNNWKNL